VHTLKSFKNADRLSQRQVTHRDVWERKPALRLLYGNFHQQLLGNCPEGRVLDIGSGTAHIKEFRSDIVSTDIQWFPGIDLVADAHQLPFRDGSFSGIVMLDVLHHLERPIDFLKEASRVLRPGGRIAMIEPAMTTIAHWFYDRYHEEPVDMKADAFVPGAINPDRDPFDANQAIPTLLFAYDDSRRRVEQEIASLQVRSVEWHSVLAYPLSGGFQTWSLLPARLVAPLLAFERCLPPSVKKHLSFRMTVVMERR
jgi:SAM-dependent methyltransferase